MREKMSKQPPPPAPTASTVGPCPTVTQIRRTPRHWKFSQHHRTTDYPLMDWQLVASYFTVKSMDIFCSMTKPPQLPFQGLIMVRSLSYVQCLESLCYHPKLCGRCTRCSVTFGSFSSQGFACFSLTLLLSFTTHTQAYRKMDTVPKNSVDFLQCMASWLVGCFWA